MLALKKRLLCLKMEEWKSKIFYILQKCTYCAEKHLEEDVEENKIGTTRRGIGPAYRDKYARTGIRAESVPEFTPYLIDLYKNFILEKKIILGRVLKVLVWILIGGLSFCDFQPLHFCRRAFKLSSSKIYSWCMGSG